MQLPNELITPLRGINGYDEEEFIASHLNSRSLTSVRVNPQKRISLENIMSSVPWASDAWYLQERPSFTFDPFFHAGCYYVQEASSMFLEQAIRQTVDLNQKLKIVDLCAAPGGKSTHLLSLINDQSFLVSNEVIKSRVSVLKENIIKWGSGRAVVSNNDPKDFGGLEGYFDVMVIDAPCSGSGLFRRDAEAINEWSENNVQLCAQRQTRIIADAWPALKKEGILIYATCSFSKNENEDIVDWISDEYEVESLPLKIQSDWGITEVKTEKNNFAYRFWPHRIQGEGFFLAVLKKKSGTDFEVSNLKTKPATINKKEIEIVNKWVREDEFGFIKNKSTVYAWPLELVNDFQFLLNKLKIIYSGTIIGEFFHEKIVPSHALAMSCIYDPNLDVVSVTKEEAIRYLQRKDLSLNLSSKGWKIIAYENKPLGWVNVLTNRINNYYPKELRILKNDPN